MTTTGARQPLSVDVYVTPMRPVRGAPPQGPGDEPMWSPMSSTLIHGATKAVLVDTLVTFDQANALADWVDGFGKQVIAILITHGHADHWIGLRRLLERFPGARAIASPAVKARAAFEATDPALRKYWLSVFPSEIPDDPTIPDATDETSFDLESERIDLIDIGQGDTEHSTLVHIPSIAAVVAGDVVYNQVHMMTGETDERSRAAWMNNLDRIAAMNPRTVVSGHKRVGAPDAPQTIAESKKYLADFTRVVNEHDTVEKIVRAMLELHPNRDNPRVVWHSARQAVPKRR
jgi:glyoxylase-like metal-dependent hydrolase (beta-lactamase superfamily II)